MPVIKNRVIRNIPEQVAKNTSDILALQGGYDLSQSPFIEGNVSYEDGDYIISFLFVKSAFPKYIYCELLINGVSCHLSFVIERNSGNQAYEATVEAIDDPDGDFVFNGLTIDNTSAAYGVPVMNVDIKFTAQAPYDDYKFVKLLQTECTIFEGEITQ